MKFSLQFAKLNICESKYGVFKGNIFRTFNEKKKTEWALFIRNRNRLGEEVKAASIAWNEIVLKQNMYMYFGWLLNSYNNPKVKAQSSKLFATAYENWYNSFLVNFLTLNSRARYFLFFSAILFSIISINSIMEFNGIFLIMCFIVSCASS